MSTEAQVNPKGAASIIPDLLAAEARIADLRRQLADAERRATEAEAEAERDALLRGNVSQYPDLGGAGSTDAYWQRWQRMKIDAAIRHLRDIEDYYRPMGDNIFAQARADRVRDIYEQLGDDYLYGNLGRPTMAERVRTAEAQLAAQAETLRRMREALLRLASGVPGVWATAVARAALADTASQDTPAPDLHYPAEVYSYGHKCNCGSLVPANGDDWHRHVTEYGLPALTPAPAQEGNR